MVELVRFIASSLADQPDLVRVNAADGDEATVITLAVAQDDLGKMIGKQGRTARAMRSLLAAGTAEQSDERSAGRPVRLEIVAG
jgi:predicted RNA-binding protein YlqC (UPF0109 family)